MTVVIFIIVLGVLILVHELGHFIMAKRAGMKVEEFGFGFPPRLWGIKKGETVYSINWIPFGGFVKILGEDGADKDNPRSFAAKGFWARFNTLIAGVTMNFLLAAFLLMAIFLFFDSRLALNDSEIEGARDLKILVEDVLADSPSQNAGIQPLDEIIGFREGDKMVVTDHPNEIVQYVRSSNGREITMVIKRGGEEIEKVMTPRLEGDIYKIGLSPIATGLVRYPWYDAVWRGPYAAVIMLERVVIGFGALIGTLLFKGTLIGDVSGPVGIAKIVGQAAQIGFSSLLQIMAIISVNLAVLNVLPLPALDGGRILFLIIEKIKGSPIKKNVEAMVNAISFALLIALMIYVTIKDVAKLF